MNHYKPPVNYWHEVRKAEAKIGKLAGELPEDSPIPPIIQPTLKYYEGSFALGALKYRQTMWQSDTEGLSIWADVRTRFLRIMNLKGFSRLILIDHETVDPMTDGLRDSFSPRTGGIARDYKYQPAGTYHYVIRRDTIVPDIHNVQESSDAQPEDNTDLNIFQQYEKEKHLLGQDDYERILSELRKGASGEYVIFPEQYYKG